LAAEGAVRAEIEGGHATGIEPLDYLLALMRVSNEDKHMRFAAAKAAAPYRHPQLQSTQYQVMGGDGQPVRPRIVEV
jgi:hypothetical protein